MKKYSLGSFRPVALLILSGLMALTFTSCFTGVESTKKIELSRSDRRSGGSKAMAYLMDSVEAAPLSRWQKGRPFYVMDNRLQMMLIPRDGYSSESSDSLQGKILLYEGVGSRQLPDGSEAAIVSFSHDGRVYDYSLSRSLRSAMSTTRSDALPMLTDIDMVEQADNLLKGKKLWIRTHLWYNPDGSRRRGDKFVPVTITGVGFGNNIFPLSVKFVDQKGDTSFLYMNLGHGEADSRSFDSLFSLSDIKKKFPRISSEVWNLICKGNVDKGMTKEECRLAIGAPADVSVGHDWNQTVDIWKYEDGKYLVFSDGRLSDYRL